MMSNQERHIAEYLAGRMSHADREAFEAALQENVSLQQEVESLRRTTDLLGHAFAENPTTAFRLRADRRERILAEARGDVVSFPQSKSESGSGIVRLRRGYYRRHAGLVAAAIAIVLGGVLGHEAGREQFDRRTVGAAQTTELPQTQIASDTADSVHPYPPAYGMDLPGAWRFRSVSPAWRSPIDFATRKANIPAYVGLPGPRPEYLAARNVDRSS